MFRYDISQTHSQSQKYYNYLQPRRNKESRWDYMRRQKQETKNGGKFTSPRKTLLHSNLFLVIPNVHNLRFDIKNLLNVGLLMGSILYFLKIPVTGWGSLAGGVSAVFSYKKPVETCRPDTVSLAFLLHNKFLFLLLYPLTFLVWQTAGLKEPSLLMTCHLFALNHLIY